MADADLAQAARRLLGDGLDLEAVRELAWASARADAHLKCPCPHHRDREERWCEAVDDVPTEERVFLTAGRLRAAGLDVLPVNGPVFSDVVSWPEVVIHRAPEWRSFRSLEEAVAELSSEPSPKFAWEPRDPVSFRFLVERYDRNEEFLLRRAVSGEPSLVARVATGRHRSYDETRWLEHIEKFVGRLAAALVLRRDIHLAAGSSSAFDPCDECAAVHLAAGVGTIARHKGHEQVAVWLALLSPDRDVRVGTRAALVRAGRVRVDFARESTGSPVHPASGRPPVAEFSGRSEDKTGQDRSHE